MGRSVLVVDDDAAFRDLAARVLATWGHHVVGQAATVAEAMDCALRLHPDTVLADIGLPDGNGFELATLLRALPAAPCVVLISSDADVANGPAATRVGAVGFVPKDELSDPHLRSLLDDRGG